MIRVGSCHLCDSVRPVALPQYLPRIRVVPQSRATASGRSFARHAVIKQTEDTDEGGWAGGLDY